MTLDEAIYREEALAYSYKRRIEEMETTDPTPLENMEKEHRQLAEWLRELRAYRMFKDTLYKSCDEWCKFPQYKENRTMCGACDLGGIQDLLENALEEVNADEVSD